MDYTKKYKCLNLTPKSKSKTLDSISAHLDWLCDTQMDLQSRKYEYIINYHFSKIEEYLYKQMHIIHNKDKIINGIIAIQRKYKNYLYSPKSKYGKKLIENGENNLQEFIKN